MDFELLGLYPYNVAHDIKLAFLSKISNYVGPQYCFVYADYNEVKMTCVSWIHFTNLTFMITFLWALLCLFRLVKL